MNFGDLIFQLFAIGALILPLILLIVLFQSIRKYENKLSRLESKIDYLIKLSKKDEKY